MIDKDKTVIRNLAKQVAEIADHPKQSEKAKIWTAHNDLKITQPLIFADPENGWNEILPSRLVCEDNIARGIEYELRKRIFYDKEMKDDRIIDNYWDVGQSIGNNGWGVEIKKTYSSVIGGSFKDQASIIDYDEDLGKIHYPEYFITEEQKNQTKNSIELYQDLFGDIMKVRVKNGYWWSLGMTRDFIALRGYDNFLMDFIDNEENVHKLMSILSKGVLNMLDFLEKNNLFSQNTENTYVGSGGFGYTNDLPIKEDKVTTMDMWGFCESQETVCVGPEMFNELILPYQMPILERFGLNCYACCEPIDTRWKYIKNIPRLRRVSASPWCNKKSLAEQMGKQCIMSVKPSPTTLATAQMDEKSARNEIKQVLQDAKGCILEFIMKDNHTLGKNPKNITRWVEIVREEIEKA